VTPMSGSYVAEDWRSYGATGLPRVLEGALEAFARHGYHGTSIRDLAAAADLSVPGLYHHYSSKQEILAELMMTIMDGLLARSRAALESAGDDPSERFDAVVESMLRFHMMRRAQAFVASSEIRSLDSGNRERYVARRDEQQALVDHVVSAGIAVGAFTTVYPEDAARAVSSLCVGLASWYRDDGPLSPDELVVRHLALARGIIGAH
jgi:AcrR family transcriptional regulator